MECKKCKSFLKSDMNYCPFCGAPTYSKSYSQPKSTNDLFFNKIKELEKKKDYDTLVQYALSGNVLAEYVYIEYVYAQGCKNKDINSLEKIRETAKQNNTTAMTILGIYHYAYFFPRQSILRDPNYDVQYEKAIKTIQEAAKLGEIAAMSYLGSWLAAGDVKGVQKNEMDAYKYTKYAADKYYPEAMYRLGVWHLNGTHGASKVPDIGNTLIEKAAYYGVPAAMAFLKEKDEKWFETDPRANENKEAQELSSQLLTSFKEYNIKRIANDNIHANELIELDKEIKFNSKKIALYKTERDPIAKVISKCNSIADYLRVLDSLKATRFLFYDKTLDVRIIRSIICEKAGAENKYLDNYIKITPKYANIENNQILINKIDTTQNILLDRLLTQLRKRQCNNDLGYYRIYESNLYDYDIYNSWLDPLHNGGNPIANCKKLEKIRNAFHISTEKNIYLVNPNWRRFSKNDHYDKKTTGYIITAEGIYCKNEAKKRGSEFISWNDFAEADIYKGKLTLKKKKEIVIFINHLYFRLYPMDIQLEFLLNLRAFIRLVHQAKPSVSLIASSNGNSEE